MSATLEGGCLCGRIRYRMPARPLEAEVCHCRSCRRAAGADSVAWATVPRTDFELSGELAHHASSPGIRRGFCPACGTSLTFDRGDDTVDVTLASLDDPEAVPPTAEIWLAHRLSWNPANPDLAPHDRES